MGNSSPEVQAIVERWNGFLKKIEGRYYEVLQQTEAPLEGVIGNIQFDNVIIHNIANGLKNQTVTQLAEKVDAAAIKVEGELKKAGASGSLVSGERGKIHVLKNWMEIEYLKFEVGLFARAAKKILENVKNHIDEKKMHRCTQCGAELPINVFSFMAINLKCDSCGSVNTYQPDDRVKALEYYVITPLAEEFAFSEKLKARTDKGAMKEYYKKYYGYLMDNVPDKKSYYERDLHERLTNPMFMM
jgi:lipopolysaccharide biosynthesis regulator YciM